MKSVFAMVLVGLGLLTACTAPDGTKPGAKPGVLPAYLGVETRLLDDDLVSFQVTMRGAAGREDVAAYAECAAARYALIRGYGFARHVRTQVTETRGVWHGDAAYVISNALPDGVRTIDAEVVVADCAERAIPTV
ncbi:MAG: hypothetical protein CR993_02100 [Rhodobacterales bacterium]|nr:MAG: hypothetical protein CR993_02100 [Rhodobacterales bacterium]